MKKLFLIIVVVLVLVGCSNKPNITGEWERQGDLFAGMRVQVEKLDDGTFRGTLTKADPDGNFKVGDVKWYRISKVSDAAYDYDDIGTEGEIYKVTVKMVDSDTLNMRELVKSNAEVGTEQTWKRVK